ncbi:MAG: Crp/Fnr family transcriptional regulator [Prevotella sp.]|nr:Crp/Fnr family transcriptional regulator [Prevotella sp.]
MNIDYILQAPFFKGLTEREVLPLLLSPRNGRRNYSPGSFIAFQGDECRSIYLLTEGQVLTQMVNEEGKQITIEVLDAPLLLSPAFVFAKNNKFPVNVEVITNSEVILINKEVFLDFLHQYPDAMLNFIMVVSNRSQLLSDRLNQFALQNLKPRLLNYIKAHKYIGSQQQVSQILGVARPSLARAISELIAEGSIVADGKDYKIIK